jgi:hypothetical protein
LGFLSFVDILDMKVPLKERPRKFWLSVKDIHHPSLYVKDVCFVDNFAKKMHSKQKLWKFRI